MTMPRKPRVLPDDEALTPDEAATHAGVTVRTIKRWVAKGHLTRYQARVNLLRVSKPELDKFLDARKVPAPARTPAGT
jgi:excisionase family DNA binding protein